MDVSLIYSSQTGNTRKVAEAMDSAFREAGHTVRTVPLKKANAGDITGSDLFGIGAPSYANQAPTPVRDFIARLPRISGLKTFVFATSAGAPGRVLYDMARSLQRKEADVVGGFMARGEVFHPAPCIVGRYPGRPDEEDLQKAHDFALALGEHVAAGRTGPLPGSRPDALRPGRGFYDVLGLVLKDQVVRLTMPLPKLDKALCDGCGRCVAVCTMDNITLGDYPTLGKNCIRCYGCLVDCPREAFSADWRLGNPVLFSLYNTAFERWFGDVEPGEVMYPD